VNAPAEATAASVTCAPWFPPPREARIASARAASDVHCARPWLQHVRGLVRHDAGELGLVLREEDEPRVHADVSADEGEGIDRVVLDREVIDVAARAVGRGEEPRAEGGDIVGDLRVVHVHGVDPHLAHDAVADGALLLLGERGRGDVAEVGQGLAQRRKDSAEEAGDEEDA